jgi:hypothetical protein
VIRSKVPRLRDFGFDAGESPYHFAVVIDRSQQGEIRIEERFTFEESSPEQPGREPHTKAILDGYRWSRIADATRTEFNRRLATQGQRAAWRARETLLAPHLGKELTLLAWAIEDADPTVIPNVIANWRGLAPEERWWLYTTVNATSGHPEHSRDRGWRKAIKVALAENPSVAATPGTIDISEAMASRPDLARRPRARKRPAHAEDGTQLTLLGGDRS